MIEVPRSIVPAERTHLRTTGGAVVGDLRGGKTPTTPGPPQVPEVGKVSGTLLLHLTPRAKVK